MEELLFPSIADVSVVSVDVSNETMRVEARNTTTGSACSGCGNWSIRVHSSYLRFPADVPSAGCRVVLCLRVRRFACPVASCGRRMVVEQVPGLTRRYGRWTERLRSTLAAVGLALAGRGELGWLASLGCQSAAARCCGSSIRCPNRMCQPREWSASTSTRHAKCPRPISPWTPARRWWTSVTPASPTSSSPRANACCPSPGTRPAGCSSPTAPPASST
ncbi:transposase family protein [Streptomyces sp. NBC_01235]|uniref:transposase family protein n=1 Tax=Streptomyces sp. NBC_01235 TaxID=2903788 RepID=UPI003FA37709